jgi:protein SCO1/2
MAIEKVLLLCYQYDPTANTYVMFATNFMRFGGALTALGIALFILKLFSDEQKAGTLVGLRAKR